jgi:hypothetical protein
VKNLAVLLAALALFLTTAHACPPRLEKHGRTQNLLVYDKPFLILGKKLAKSDAASAECMKLGEPRHHRHLFKARMAGRRSWASTSL